MTRIRYNVVIAQSGKMDVKNKKKYILQRFKYREYAENFSQKMKKALKQLDTFPKSYDITGLQYRGYEIYLKPYNNYLLFYIVDEEAKKVVVLRVLQDGMDWENIIKRWLNRTADEDNL